MKKIIISKYKKTKAFEDRVAQVIEDMERREKANKLFDQNEDRWRQPFMDQGYEFADLNDLAQAILNEANKRKFERGKKKFYEDLEAGRIAPPPLPRISVS